MVVFVLSILIIILFIPINFKTLLHNNKITIYIIVLGINFKVLNKENLIKFEEKSAKEVKSSKIYNALKNRIQNNKGYLKKIKFFDILKNISKYLKFYLEISTTFGFERRDITALIYGILSSVLPIMPVYARKVLHNFNFIYNLYPDFSKSCLEVKVISNIKTNLFRLLLIIFILVKEILRVRRIYKVN